MTLSDILNLGVIIISITIIVLLYSSAIIYQRKLSRARFKCSKCGNVFKRYYLGGKLMPIIVSPFYYLRYIWFKAKWFIRCPQCRKFTWCSVVIIKESKGSDFSKDFTMEPEIIGDSDKLYKRKTKRVFFMVIGIIIFILVFVIVGIMIKQYSEMSKEEGITETISEDETTDWKNYRNEEYGFEIKYPKEWEFKKGDESIAYLMVLGNPLQGEKTFYFEIEVEENIDSLTAKEWIKNVLKENDIKKEEEIPGYIIFQEEKELVVGNNIPAYELYGVYVYDAREEFIVVSNNDYVYIFRFPIAKENDNLSNSVENNKIIHQVLSTFKFLD